MVNGFRDNTIRLLEDLRDLDAMVGPIELCCGWFNDLYHPGTGAWEEVFVPAEKLALAEFHACFSALASNISQDFQQFRRDPSWQLVSQAAEIALRQLGRSAA